MMAMARTIAFVGKIAFEIPELLPILEEHLEDNGGELLPHVLMGRISASFLEEYGNKWTAELVVELDKHLGEGDDPISNLIALSFLENLSSEPKVRNFFRQNDCSNLLKAFGVSAGNM